MDKEIGTVRGELATLEAEVNRLLDIATPANRDFVDERLGKIRVRKQELEARLADLERLDYQPAWRPPRATRWPTWRDSAMC